MTRRSIKIIHLFFNISKVWNMFYFVKNYVICGIRSITIRIVQALPSMTDVGHCEYCL